MVLAGPTELLAFLWQRQLIWWRISWLRFGVAKGERPCWLVSSQPVLNGGVYLPFWRFPIIHIHHLPMTNEGLNAKQCFFFCVYSVWLHSLCVQRRLRHLRSIAARNIMNKNGSPLLDTFFTLHLCVEDCISRGVFALPQPPSHSYFAPKSIVAIV